MFGEKNQGSNSYIPEHIWLDDAMSRNTFNLVMMAQNMTRTSIVSSYIVSYDLMILFYLMKKDLSNDGHQIPQYQQNEQSP